MKFILLSVSLMVILTNWGCQKKIDPIQTYNVPTQSTPPFKLNTFPDSCKKIRLSSPYFKNEIIAIRYNGRYIIDNDIMISEDQLQYLKSPKLSHELAIRSSSSKTEVKINGAYKVPDPNGFFLNFWRNGLIPYEIGSGFSSAHQAVIIQAMAAWASVSGVRFTQRNSFHAKFISFVPTVDINSADIGVQNSTSGGQIINLGTSAGPDLTTAIHEIGHAMGLFHEHSRSDRGNFITINTTNIASGMAHNFNTYLENSLNGVDVGPFDFNSIMLYPSIITDGRFVNNITIATLKKIDNTEWGRNTSISSGDAATASQLFGPPYARLELVNKYFDETYSGQTHSIYSIDDVYIKVYADSLCTTPYTGSSSITVRLTFYEYTPSESKSHLTLTIPSGTNSYLLYSDLVSKNYYADYGFPIYDETRVFTPRSGNFR